MDKIVKLENIYKIYPGPVPTRALTNINVEIAKSGMTAIIGQSGSGKTTLLNLIGTLDYPSEGKIEIDGVCSSCMNAYELAQLRNSTIGFVFQFHHLLPEFSVLENILMPYQIAGRNINDKIIKKAEEIMDFVGIYEIRDKPSMQISGGQKQRTAIARALINSPKIILADEPTGNLDSDTSRLVFDLFNQINRKQKTTFIIITHDERIAQKATHQIELKDGQIIKDNSL